MHRYLVVLTLFHCSVWCCAPRRCNQTNLDVFFLVCLAFRLLCSWQSSRRSSWFVLLSVVYCVIYQFLEFSNCSFLVSSFAVGLPLIFVEFFLSTNAILHIIVSQFRSQHSLLLLYLKHFGHSAFFHVIQEMPVLGTRMRLKDPAMAFV